MTMSKMALLGAVVVASVVIGSGTLAWVRNGAVTADHENADNYVFGPDGRLIGAAPTRAYVPSGSGTVFRISPKSLRQQKAPRLLELQYRDRENFLYRAAFCNPPV